MSEIHVGGTTGKVTHHMIKPNQVLVIEGSRNSVTVMKLMGTVHLAGTSNTVHIMGTEGQDALVIKKSASGTVIVNPGAQVREIERLEAPNNQPRVYRAAGNQQQYDPYGPNHNANQYQYQPYGNPNQGQPQPQNHYQPYGYPQNQPERFNPISPSQIGFSGAAGLDRVALMEAARNNPSGIGVMNPNAPITVLGAQGNLNVFGGGQNYTPANPQTSAPGQYRPQTGNYTPVNTQSNLPNANAGNYISANVQSGLNPLGPPTDDLV